LKRYSDVQFFDLDFIVYDPKPIRSLSYEFKDYGVEFSVSYSISDSIKMRYNKSIKDLYVKNGEYGQ
jgi:hypothetical protein